MIYMDHAATSLGKPPGVAKAAANAILTMGNPGRGAHEASLAAARTIYETRKKIAELFYMQDADGMPAADRVVFTANATEALNLVIKGLFSPGDHVITTEMEHNSVLRPLYEMEMKGVELTILSCDAKGCISLAEMEAAVKKNTKAVICTHASNVTGNVNDIAAIGMICKKYNLDFILDTAQTAGSFEIDMEENGISAIIFAGHKGLLGPQGIGGVCLASGVLPRPFVVGGSGVYSFSREHPGELPVALEAGTPNVPGIAGLGAALDFLTSERRAEIRAREETLTKAFYDGICDIPGIHIYGDITSIWCLQDGMQGEAFPAKLIGQSTLSHAPVISLNIAKIDSGEIASLLAEEYRIAVRAGVHCAPLMHQRMGTERQGAVRFSFSAANTIDEVNTAIRALQEIAASCRGRVISYVGAGGKTGSIRKDAARYAREGSRVLIMTTTKMACRDVEEYPGVWVHETDVERLSGWKKDICPVDAGMRLSTDCNEYIEKVKSIFNNYNICTVGIKVATEQDVAGEEKNSVVDKFMAPPAALLEALLYEADVILIEADGAAHKAAKAPEAWEPVLLPCTDEVVVVMGEHAIGHTVEEACHRKERVMEVLACDKNHKLTRENLVHLMEEGYEKTIREKYPKMEFRRVFYKKEEKL